MAVERISGMTVNNASASTASTVSSAANVSTAKTAVADSTAKKVEQQDADKRGYEPQKLTVEEANEKIRKAVEKLNEEMSGTECRYSFHDDTNRIMIRVVDKESEEVIKEFPAEDTLNMIFKSWELAGILVDEKL